MSPQTNNQPDRITSTAGAEHYFALPVVRPISIGTAHPEADFDQLQRRLPMSHAASRAGSPNRSILVVPSRAVEKWYEPAAVTQAYEERLLCTLLELRDPGLRMTYVTSSPIPASVVDYQLSLLPRRVRSSARSRVTFVALGDHSPRPLGEKLLERPLLLEQIRRTIPDDRLSYISPFQTTEAERELSVALGIPLYGADPRHERLGSKSGARALFAESGVPCPAGVEDLSTVESVIDAIASLRAKRPNLDQLVLKLDRGVSGEGNAIVDVAGLPASGAADEPTAIRARLAAIEPEAPGVSVAAFLAKLATGGGIIEERITGCELRSPSVQIEITPDGAAVVVSTHDQILGGASGQSYLGCRFPAEASYAPMISRLAQRVGDRLAARGVIGRLALDFVLARDGQRSWRAYAIEINLRKGGTTHPYQTLVSLTGGTYDAATAAFTTPTGVHKHYVATDHLESPALTSLGRSGVLALARRPELRFDRMRRTGTVFHMLSSIDEAGQAGFTAIGDSAEEADSLYELTCRTVLTAAAGAAARIGPQTRELDVVA